MSDDRAQLGGGLATFERVDGYGVWAVHVERGVVHDVRRVAG